MMAHVDHLAGFLRSSEGGFDDRLGAADESDDGAVGGFAGIDIEQHHAVYALNGVGDLLDNTHIAPLTEVGDALDDSLLGHSIGIW